MADVKWSQFPQAAGITSTDSLVGLQNNNNTRFSFATILAWVRQQISSFFVPKTDVGAAGGVASLDNTGKVPTSQLPSSTGPEPATATPLMDGTGAVGTSTKYAREDHEHPADTNKQNKITANGILKGDGAGGVSAATAGTDYQAPLTAGTDYATPAQLADKANIDEIGIVVNSNSSAQGAAIGQYVILRNSMITGKADGLYKAVKVIPANTTIDGTYLEAEGRGGLNALVGRMGAESFTATKASIISDGNCYGYYDKTTNTVRIYAYVYYNSTIFTQTTTCFTVPAQYRPAVNTDLYGVVSTGSYIAPYFGVIDTNGNITQKLSGAAREFFLMGEYTI